MAKLLEDLLNRVVGDEVIFMFGTSGHARELSELVSVGYSSRGINSNAVVVHVDKEISEVLPQYKKVSSLRVVSESDFIEFLRKSKELYGTERKYNVILGIGSPKVRSRLVSLLARLPVVFPNLIGPWARYPNSEKHKYIDPRGLVMAPNCTLTTGISLGKHVHLNTGCIVCHDAGIGDFSIIGPGAIVCGNVTMGSRCYIGAGVTIRDGVSLADDVTLGAGSVVVNNIINSGTYIGCPAKYFKEGSL